MSEYDSLVRHYSYYNNLGIYQTGMLNAAEEPVPRYVRSVRDGLLPQVLKGFQGFETPMPSVLDGCQVLLLGCGTGRDAFVASRLVGPKGRVVAVDPYASNIAKAESQAEAQAQAFKQKAGGIRFLQGYPEDLSPAGLQEGSFQAVLLNYSFNLAADQPQVLREAWRLLAEGGEVYLGALFSNCRITPAFWQRPEVQGIANPLLHGAVYTEDFRRWLRNMGCEAFRYMQKRRIELPDKAEKEALKEIDFTYRIIRAFKLANLEDLCENYGQSAEYLGTIPEFNQFFDLDDKHRFFVDKPIRVCGNTCALVENTRFAPHFRIQGSRHDRHYGLYTYCPYCGFGKDEEDVIEYLEDGKEVCSNCSHKAFCTVDGHCQHEE